MAPSLTSADQASTWLHPDQIERLRTACYQDCFQSPLQQRNDALITLLYDTGLRVGDLVQLTVDHLNLDTGTIQRPTGEQHETRQTSPPSPDPLELDPAHSLGTVRLLISYLSSREGDSTILFPSRNGGRLTPKAVRDVVAKAANSAELRPYTPYGRGTPADISPQTLRHSTAWRLLNVENRSIEVVRDRLRHTALSTTKSLYAGFDADEDRAGANTGSSCDTAHPESAVTEDVLGAVPDLLYAFNRNGQMIWWNDRVSDITGYTDAEIAEMHALEFVAREDRAEIADAIAHILGRELIESREAHLVTKANEYLPYEFTGAPITDDEGTVQGVAGVGRDITARKRFERISDGFYALDTDWRFTYLNSQAEALVDRSEEDLLGAVVWGEFLAAVDLQVYEEFHTAMETQEPVSFDQYYPPLDTWFSVRAYPSETGLSVYFRDITDRKERERALERQRTELERLNQFTELVQNLVHAVVEESTRTEIEQTVCDQLAASDFYRAAWIGDRARTTATITPRVSAGVELDAVPTVPTESTGGESSSDLATRAVDTRDACVAQQPIDELYVGGNHNQSWGADIESALAVPIEYGDVLYGVLVVYATQATAFGDRQQASFVDLSETIGFAIAAAERKEALVAERVLELTLSIRDPDQFFIQAATQCDATTTLDGIAGRGEDAYLAYFTVTGTSPAAVRDLEEQREMPDHVRVVSTHETSILCEVRITDSSLITTVADYGGTVTDMTAENDHGTVRIELPRTADVGRVLDALRATGADVELQAKRTVDRPIQTDHRFQAAVTDRLTDKQRHALEAAYHAGFFEQPRDSTGEDIAESMDISPSTFHQHLRVGLRKLVAPIAETPKESA